MACEPSDVLMEFNKNIIQNEEEEEEICAAEANDIAMEAVSSLERPIVMRRIYEAAHQGKFQTFIDWVSSDTVEWLEQDLGFETESCGGGRIVKWKTV